MSESRLWWQCPGRRACYPQLLVDVREGVTPEVEVRHWCVGTVEVLPFPVWWTSPPRPSARVSS